MLNATKKTGLALAAAAAAVVLIAAACLRLLPGASGGQVDSVILLERIRTLDKKRLRERMGRVDGAVMEKVDAAIAVSFGLTGRHLV